MNRNRLRFLFSVFALMLVSGICTWAQGGSAADEKDLQPGSPVLMQANELAKLLKSSHKPLVFFVGPRAFYQQSHVPGAEFLGPSARPDGMEKLRTRAASLLRQTPIVIYCGCCPWVHCPNIGPAYRELKKLGFTRLRVLYLETSFGTNWAEKGFPVEKAS